MPLCSVYKSSGMQKRRETKQTNQTKFKQIFNNQPALKGQRLNKPCCVY